MQKKTTQLGNMNGTTQQEKTTQLSSRNEQLNSATGTNNSTRQQERNNSTLHCRRPPTIACYRLHRLHHLQPPAPPLQQNRLFLPTDDGGPRLAWKEKRREERRCRWRIGRSV
ncbi:hypothetical protein TNCV_234021 [Trichonephila clavipes]|nr:hypothetical protein TNCV_234021 [Trichonephila clavipes]